MNTNTHLEAGCVFDAEVQMATGGLGFPPTHVEIALRHTNKKGLDISFDPDAFVLLEQLRFAYLVARSIPLVEYPHFEDEEKEVLYWMINYFWSLAPQLLKKGEAQSVDKKREIFRFLREFDKFSIHRADIVGAYFGHVENALGLAEQYKAFAILERLYRLGHHHPNPKMRSAVKTLLDYFVMPALNHVGPVLPSDKSPEELSGIMLALVTREVNPWVHVPSSLKPVVLNAWLKENEHAMLVPKL